MAPDQMRADPVLRVRPTVLLVLAALVTFLALEEFLAGARAWSVPGGWRLLFLLVGGLAVRQFGPRVSWQVSTVLLVAALGVLAVLAIPTPLT